MQKQSIESIRDAVAAARKLAHSSTLSSCDVDDIDDILEPVEHELEVPSPNVHTLTTYLNSLARSLRAEPSARAVVMQLDAAMRDAGVPTQWEH